MEVRHTVSALCLRGVTSERASGAHPALGAAEARKRMRPARGRGAQLVPPLRLSPFNHVLSILITSFYRIRLVCSTLKKSFYLGRILSEKTLSLRIPYDCLNQLQCTISSRSSPNAAV